VGLERSGALAHTVESLLDRLREGVLPLRPPIVELLFRVKDVIALLVEELAADQQEKSEITALDSLPNSCFLIDTHVFHPV
jgi:chemotaxis protein histidine kinase CheA